MYPSTHFKSFVAEARSWANTPYHARGRVKGAGADCGSFILAAAMNCGLVEEQEIESYRTDCWLHWSDERYLRQIMKYAAKVLEGVAYRSTEILPGSLVFTRTIDSQHINHGGIVTEWPMVVHATRPKVREVDSTTHPMWTFRPIMVFELNRITGRDDV